MNTRELRKRKLSRDYDLIVVGGGFHGACAFEQASADGIDVLLLERGDYCSGASANSLKTVHGGIRHLQNGDIRRLRQAARARQIWAQRAPRLLQPLPCVLPLPRSFVSSAPLVQLGALSYQMLTFDLRSGIHADLSLRRPGVVSKERYTSLAEPFLDCSAKHGLRWDDYQVRDSERLVMDTILAGERLGGVAVNYAEALDFDTTESDVTIVPVHDRVTGSDYSVKSRSVVSFAGSAPGDSMFSGRSTKARSRPVLAANLVVSRKLVRGGVAFRPVQGDDASGRYMFCVPWKDSTIVGTWYWHAQENATGIVEPHKLADLDEMLRDVNASLRGAKIEKSEVTRIHWGWLPGHWDATSDPEGSLVKDPMIFPSESRGQGPANAVVEGTKFTTANTVSYRVLGRIINARSSSAVPTMVPNDISPQMSDTDLESLQRVATGLGIDNQIVDRLATHYGPPAKEIVSFAHQSPALRKCIGNMTTAIRAEVAYCVTREHAVNLADVIFRRTGIGAAGVPAPATLECCAQVMAEYLGWNAAEVRRQIEQIQSRPHDGRWIDI